MRRITSGIEPGSPGVDSGRPGAPEVVRPKVRYEGDDVGEQDGDGPTALPMAEVMAEMPGVWRRLLAAHVPDRFGRCRACRTATGSGEKWPCSLHRIATQARRVHEQNLARAIDTDLEA